MHFIRFGLTDTVGDQPDLTCLSGRFYVVHLQNQLRVAPKKATLWYYAQLDQLHDNKYFEVDNFFYQLERLIIKSSSFLCGISVIHFCVTFICWYVLKEKTKTACYLELVVL